MVPPVREEAGIEIDLDDEDPTRRRFETLREICLDPHFRIVSINLFQGPSRILNIGLYYKMCVEATSLQVTTSCFSVWRENKKTNGHAKMIPAVPQDASGTSERPVCIFFFDDNIEFSGLERSSGICNLRHVETGEFVEFGEGQNGFSREHAARHTLIHHSCSYRNILVKANILDALEDREYFMKIIRRYALPGEKIVVFMDVNSTIVCNDTGEGKDMSGSLLSSMFELIEATPRSNGSSSPISFEWDSYPPVKVEKPISLKQLVRQITNNDKEAYAAFFKEQTCLRFLRELQRVAETKWSSRAGSVEADAFRQLYTQYMQVVATDLRAHMITSSWFRLYEGMREGKHTVILNSYGVDTRKVVTSTVNDERQVMHLVVNYELWEEQDVKKFEEQYRGQPPKLVSRSSPPWLARFLLPECCGRPFEGCGIGQCS